MQFTFLTKNARYLFITSLGMALGMASCFIYFLDPLKVLINKVTSLSPGSLAFSLWSNPPYDIFAKAYIYHVTNAEAFLSGKEKLRLEEKGPYVYKESIHNTQPKFNDNGTLTFIPVRYLEFIPELSVADPKTEMIVCPNIPLLGITAALQNYSMFVNLAVSSVSSYLGSPSFVNTSVHDYLFGYDDPLVSLANKVVPNWIDFPRFGIIDRLLALDNSSNVITISVDPSKKVSENTLLTLEERTRAYAIQRWNGSPGLKVWGYKEPQGNETVQENSRCNLVEGTFEGLIFPRHLKRNTTFKLYRRAFCRPVPFVYESEGYTNEGFHSYTYTVADNFLAKGSENPENQCFCLNGNCLPRGLGDMTPCYYDIPIVMSQPHFLNADPSLLADVDGLSPDEEKHNTKFIIHPEMGLPLKANMKIQINLRMTDTKYNHKTRPFNNLTLPLFWVELNANEIPSSIYLYLTLLYHVLPVVQEVMMYVFALSSIIIVSSTAYKFLFAVSNPQDTRRPKINYRIVPLTKDDLLCPDEIMIRK
ncbi:scavenger receptor class B member 1 [Agrilus planipennis]|uniref:Scavenger receptor class B member 1 n=1 Tax=Agrilus planipennis TaxID=224129 RepID=A0A1W4WGT2_AGRPL|nr:scavenger receptor class B member 1 [Agrilus planipennis]